MRRVGLRSLIALGFVFAASMFPLVAQQTAPPAAPRPPLILMSLSFSDGGEIPLKYSCAAKPAGVSPALQWINAPAGVVSYTLIVHDPDVQPGKSMYDALHWIVWNIPARLTELPEGVPASAQMLDGSIQGKNIRGVTGYQGPCPSPGKPHHYTFELYALDTKLDAGADASRADVLKAMDGHIIAKAVYVGFFHQ